jgi:septal ring factor EnvC (AmiA/AmiB activator)
MTIHIRSILISGIIFILLATPGKARDTGEEINLDNGNIEQQFDYLIRESNNYEIYEVVRRTWMNKIQSNVLDSLHQYKETIRDQQQIISGMNTDIDSLNSRLQRTRAALNESIAERDSLILLGIKMDKIVYNSILWTIILVLAGFMVFFFILFKRSNKITNQTRQDLKETTDEFEAYKKYAREKHEKTVVKYHDEIRRLKESNSRNNH